MELVLREPGTPKLLEPGTPPRAGKEYSSKKNSTPPGILLLVLLIIMQEAVLVRRRPLPLRVLLPRQAPQDQQPQAPQDQHSHLAARSF